MSSDWLGDHDVGFFDLDAARGLDPARLAVFRNYLEQEYAGPFLHGMGSYEILDMVRRFVGEGRRLDVGGGSRSLVIAFRERTRRGKELPENRERFRFDIRYRGQQVTRDSQYPK